MERIIGAEPVPKEPSAARHAESAGSAVAANTAAPITKAIPAIFRPFCSFSPISSIFGRSSLSPSISVFASLGSIILSVIYQPRLTMTTDDAVVKK